MQTASPDPAAYLVAAGPPENPPTIRFDRVVKYLKTGQGRRWILRDTSFELKRGHSIGILGRNGAGKSTVLRMMCGMEQPNSGTVTRFARVSWPLGLGGSLQGSLTGVENSRFVARIYGAPADEVVAFVRMFSELDRAVDLPVRTYSAGMRARLVFAMSMALEFRCYLIDELTAVGDLRFRQKCEETFAARRASADVIIVSHQMPTIRAFADSVAIIHDGQMLFFDDVDDGIYYYDTMT
jgi:capsular polysaccharide transport system ATP-binding protein